jgi:phenylacetic acid degradation operon negative regulatory protein
LDQLARKMRSSSLVGDLDPVDSNSCGTASMSKPPIPGPLAASEPLQPQDLVITLLGTYRRQTGDTIWSGGLVELLGELGFSTGAARVALTRLVRRDFLTRVRHGRLVHYRLTPRADRLLAEGDDRIFSFGTTRDDGGSWTLLWHQIPEDRRLERTRLATRLRFLGFGPVQDSVWVSPHDHEREVVGLLRDLAVEQLAAVFVARPSERSGLAAFAAKGWDLDSLADRYDAFCAEFRPYMPATARRRLTDREAFLVRTWLMHLFRAFPQLDPELPQDLAPVAKGRSRAAAIFQRLYAGLAEPAQRHFERVVTGYTTIDA